MTSNLDDSFESICKAVHNSWWKQKDKDGFHHPSKCLNRFESYPTMPSCRFCNLSMVPYEDLDEEVKNYDRATVRTVLNALELLGYKIE